jgi:gamma-glutamylcyclotransferase (GGCT)/AIG2-like uncharacterized protein YtfP
MDLFVYGSLKKGFSNHHFLEGAVFLGQAVTRDAARLIDCGGFPGIVPPSGDGDYQIEGEVWRIQPESLPAIDWLEDVDTGIYCRTEWPVLLGEAVNRRETVATIYLYQGKGEGRKEVGPCWKKEWDTTKPYPKPENL